MKTFVTSLFIFCLSHPLFAYQSLIQNEDVKSITDITAAALTTSGNIASSNHCLSSPGSTQNLSIGLYIYDTTHPTYLPSGTTIAGLPGICSSGQIQMSQNATNSSSGDTFTFGGQKSQLINDSKLYTTGASLNDQLSTLLSNNRILNVNSSTAATLIAPITFNASNTLFNKSSSNTGLGGGIESQNASGTFSGVVADPSGRGLRVINSDYNNSSVGSGLDIKFSTGSGNATAQIVAINNGAGSGPIALNPTGGNVGIGLSNPGNPLDVSGSSALEGHFNSTDSNGPFTQWTKSGTSVGYVGSGASVYTGGSSTDFAVFAQSNNMKLGVGNQPGLNLDGSGNVTIPVKLAVGFNGTPSAALQVTGGNIALTSSNAFIDYGLGNPGDANEEYMLMEHNGSSGALIAVQATGSGSVRPLRVKFGSNSSAAISADMNNHVGIATDPGNTNLTINGDFATLEQTITTTGTINSYDTQGFSYVRMVSASGAVTINGIKNCYTGKRVVLVNDTGSTVTFNFNSGSAAANERIMTPGGLAFNLGYLAAVEIICAATSTQTPGNPTWFLITH